MKMTCKKTYVGRPGDRTTLYGYPGTFGDDGAAVLDVPEAFAAAEIASGRLVAVPGGQESAQPKEAAKSKQQGKAEPPKDTAKEDSGQPATA